MSQISFPLQMIFTGVRVWMPEGVYGRIAPRSGLASQFGVQVLGGVVDGDFSGHIQVGKRRKRVGLCSRLSPSYPKVIAVCLGEAPVELEQGSRIAQLIFERFNPEPPLQVSRFQLEMAHDKRRQEDTLVKPEEVRKGGFGSTGDR